MRVRMVCGVALTVVGVAGCGGKSGPSMADVISKGDAICADANAQDRALPQTSGADLTQFDNPKPAKLKAAAAYEAKLARLYVTESERLRALPEPSEKKAPFEQTLTAVKSAATATSDQVLAAEKGDLHAWKAAGTRQVAAFDRESRAAKQFGFKVCGAA